MMFLEANIIKLQDEYCIQGLVVKQSDFNPNLKPNALFTLPSNLPNFKIESQILAKKLRSLGFKIEDYSLGEIKFHANCVKENILEILKKELRKHYHNNFSEIKIKNISIQAKSSLPKDFKNYTLKDLQVEKNKLKQAHGSILAHFYAPQGKIKTMYFTFNANVEKRVLLLRESIKARQILHPNDVYSMYIKLEKTPKEPLNIGFKKLRSKFNIRKDTILSDYQFRKYFLINKGDTVQVVVKDNGFEVQTHAQALKNGDLDQSIRLKTSDGKLLTGIVKSENLVQIY